ncbi:MAG: hypothetical protein KC422_03865 [Trueperaceae bacterium]|nr:hypothetical protein [Trueperaceae bacterium]
MLRDEVVVQQFKSAQRDSYSLRQEVSRLEFGFMQGKTDDHILERYAQIRRQLAQSSQLERLLDPRD